MACRLETEKIVIGSISDIVRNDKEVFSKDTANKKVRQINVMWGKVAKAVQYSANGGYTIQISDIAGIIEKEYQYQIKQEQKLAKQFPVQQPEITERVEVNEDIWEEVDEYFNINEVDKLRKPQQRSLNKLLNRTIASMGWTKTTMKTYKLDYERRNPGKTLTQLGLANIVDQIIAIGENSEIDGVTLPEEVFHAIIASNVTSNEIQDLLTMEDADGILEISKTEVWKQNYSDYLSAYEGDEEKVKMEILGKILAQALYDKFAYRSISQRILRAIENFLSFFRIKLKMSNLLDRNQFNKDLYTALDLVLDKWETGGYNQTYAPLGAGTINVPFVFKTKTKFEDVIVQGVADLKIKVKQLEERKIGLTQNGRLRFDYLTNKYINVSNKQTAIADLEKKQAKAPLSAYEQLTLNELKELTKLKNRDDSDVELAKKVKTINTRIKEIEQLISKQQLQLGIYTYFFGADGTGGALADIQELYDYLEKVKKHQVVLGIESFNSVNQSFELHYNLITALNDWYATVSSGRNTFPELSREQNKELKKVVQALDAKLRNINITLNSEAPKVKKNYWLKYREINPDIDENENDFIDISFMRRYMFSLKNAEDEGARLFYKILTDTKNKIHSIITNNTVDLYNKHKDLIKSMGTKEFRMLKEKDSNGEVTEYWLSDRKTKVFNDTYNKFREDLIKNLTIYAKTKHNKNYNIPLDEYELAAFFNATTLNNLSSVVLDKELEAREDLRNRYNAAYGNWLSLNTELKYNYEDIIEARRLSMNKTKFAKWLELNAPTHTYIDGNGNTVSTVIYKGELIKPSSGLDNMLGHPTVDYTNTEYERLRNSRPEYIELLEDLKEKALLAKRKLPLTNYSWEYTERLPQVSKSTMDLFGDKFSNYVAQLKESVTHVVDDDMYANRAGNTILERPPIRYIEKLPPNLITDDLFKSVMMIEDMSTTFIEFTKRLPELHGMIDLVKRSNVVDKSNYIERKLSARDSISRLEARMKELMLRNVYGGKEESYKSPTIGKLDINKVTIRMRKWIVGVRLLANTTSQLTGYFAGMINKSEEIFSKNMDASILAETEKEVILNYAHILADTSSPIKTNKLTAALQYTGIVSSNIENFSNLNRSRVTRVGEQIVNYGGWRAIDVATKLPIIIATAKEIRYVNGNWYTKASYDIADDGWKNGQSLWSMIELVDNKIEFDPKVTDNIKNLWINKSRDLSMRIDGQISEIDKAYIHHNIILKFFTINMNWLYERLDRGFKKPQFNYQTQQIEGGQYVIAWRAMQGNFLGFLADLFVNRDGFSELEKQSIRRIGHSVMMSTLLMMLAYIANAIALDDDDDDDPVLNYIVYIIDRMLLEEQSKISVTDLRAYITRPADGVDQLDSYIPILKYIFAMFGESKEVESGIYKGYQVSTKELIKATPLLRGFFENLGGGIINEALGKPETSIGTSIKGKNQVIKGSINSKIGMSSYIGAGLITRTLGWASGRTIAPIVSDNYKSEFGDLPSKTANK